MEEITDHVKIYFDDRIEVESEEAREVMNGEQVPAVLSALKEKVASGGVLSDSGAKLALKEVGKTLGVKGQQIFMPVRVALTGSIHGPDLDKIMAILGKDKVIKRLSIWT